MARTLDKKKKTARSHKSATDSAGQSGDTQGLSHIAEAAAESVEELADTDQAYEAAAIQGVEDAASHPGKPVHTHENYGRGDKMPPKRGQI